MSGSSGTRLGQCSLIMEKLSNDGRQNLLETQGSFADKQWPSQAMNNKSGHCCPQAGLAAALANDSLTLELSRSLLSFVTGEAPVCSPGKFQEPPMSQTAQWVWGGGRMQGRKPLFSFCHRPAKRSQLISSKF